MEKKNILSYLNTPAKRIIAFVLAAILAFVPLHNLDKRMNSKADGEISLIFTSGIYSETSRRPMYNSEGTAVVDTVTFTVNGLAGDDEVCYYWDEASDTKNTLTPAGDVYTISGITGVNYTIKVLDSAGVVKYTWNPCYTTYDIPDGFKLEFTEAKGTGDSASGSYSTTSSDGNSLDVLASGRSNYKIIPKAPSIDASNTGTLTYQWATSESGPWSDGYCVFSSLSKDETKTVYVRVKDETNYHTTPICITIKGIGDPSGWGSQSPSVKVTKSGTEADLAADTYVKSGDTVKVTLNTPIPYWIKSIELSNEAGTKRISSSPSIESTTASLFTRKIENVVFTIDSDSETYSKLILNYYDPAQAGVTPISLSLPSDYKIIADNTNPKAKDFKVYKNGSEVTSADAWNNWYSSENLIGVEFTVEEGTDSFDASNSKVQRGTDESVFGPSFKGGESWLLYNIPVSTSVKGTRIAVYLKDKSGNENVKTNEDDYIRYIKIDGENPTASLNDTVNDVNVIPANYPIKGSVSDNLTIAGYDITVSDGTSNKTISVTSVNGEQASINKNINDVTLEELVKELVGSSTAIPDMSKTYTVTLVAKDKSGRTSSDSVAKYRYDNDQLAATVSTTAGEYNTDAITFNLWVSKKPEMLKSDYKVTIIKDGAEIPKSVTWTASGTGSVATVTTPNEAGKYKVKVEAKDITYDSAATLDEKAKHSATAISSMEYIIDKDNPVIAMSGVDNNGKYDAAKTVTYSVTDANKDDTKNIIKVDFTAPDGTKAPTEAYSGSAHTFTADGTYTVTMTATDKAGHSTTSDPVTFRVDKTDPVANITNAVKKGRKATPTLSITEAFKDATGKYTVYYSAPETTSEQALAPVAVTQGADINLVFGEGAGNANFAKDGTYRIVFEVEDAVGRKSSAETSFIIDATAPVITLLDSNGVKIAGAASKNPITLNASVFEEFFSDVTITVKGTREDINGNKATLSFDPKKATSKTTNISETFEIDGRYNVEIIATDSTGNTKSSGALMFTIDKTAPVLDTSSLDKYENAYLNNLDFAKVNVNSLVKDLTLKTTSITLNGKEFTGDATDYEDGSYILKISAEDELGNISEKEIHFILDTKAPVFLVTGVEDGQIQKDSYDITIALQLDEDTLTSVMLNGEEVAIKNNTATLSVKDDGTYELVMKAVDRAGNVSEQKISFGIGSEEEIVLDTYGTEESATTEAIADEILEEKDKVTTVNTAIDNANNYWWIWIAAVAGVLVLFFAGYFIVAKKKGGKDTPEE